MEETVVTYGTQDPATKPKCNAFTSHTLTKDRKVHSAEAAVMKLDSRGMRYLTAEDWRVLTAVETGSKNHELVPTTLIGQLSGLRSGVHRNISNLAKLNLIAKIKNAKYDGYRLTYGGLDYLSLHHHQKTKTIYSIGNQIGTGKESDILVVASPPTATSPSHQLVLKVHRLGRISFRTVKNNRDYLRKHRSSASSNTTWMQMSALAARKEFMFLKALWDAGFPVPEPIGYNRHTVAMELVDAFPLRQIKSVPDPARLYAELLEMVLRLARVGLIHGDFNEFNILIKEEEIEAQNFSAPTDPSTVSSSPTAIEERSSTSPPIHDYKAPIPTEPLTTPRQIETPIKLIPIIIDFPQCLSIDHANAEYYFDRDVTCIKRFFERRFHFISDEPGPFFQDARKGLEQNVAKGEGAGAGDGAVGRRLDVEVEASGFSKKMARNLEEYMNEVGVDGDAGAENDGGEDEDEEEDDREGEKDEVIDDEIEDLHQERDPDQIPGGSGSVERRTDGSGLLSNAPIEKRMGELGL